jgi:hypothetical protein
MATAPAHEQRSAAQIKCICIARAAESLLSVIKDASENLAT